jgi:hypothetical protein
MALKSAAAGHLKQVLRVTDENRCVPLYHRQLINVDRWLQARDNVTRFFALGCFYESSSPKPLKITLGSFRFFLNLTPVLTTPAANFATGTAGVVDTGCKFLPSVTKTPVQWQTTGTISDC